MIARRGRRVPPYALAVVALLGLAALALVRSGPAASSDWPRFGLTPDRVNAAPGGGIRVSDLSRLHRQVVHLDGTVDSSPIYLRGVVVLGHRHDVFVVTTTYGKTLAINAARGTVLWRFVPPGINGWKGSAQITTATPVADPSRRFVYAASPDGLIHKLAIGNGREARGWPVRVTLLPAREKIAAALNFSRGLVLVTTGGYIGDAPPYQGHVVSISAATGQVVHVFNSLCSDRAELIVPSSCSASDSAIWARAGAVVEPGSGNLLVATGNGPWNGRTNWGDSVLELSPDAGRLLQAYTPTNQAQLESSDADLGSTAPALLPTTAGGPRLAVQGGKDGLLRVLDVDKLNGQSTNAGPVTGGELQTVDAPGKTDVFTAPAAWRNAGHTWLFVATGAGTGAYKLVDQRLQRAWVNRTAGTSPVVAGGLVYVFDPGGGGLNVYSPTSARPIATLPAGSGHWSSPIVADGRIALPEGNANDHASSGVLDIYRR
ncbi:MAG: hypothetical protein ACXVZ1_08030 [Gaiellaceae bacterium]